MYEKLFWKVFRWFIANALLPILVPVICLCSVDFFTINTFPFLKTFIMLMRDGFYIFSALALLFSLIEDYPIFKKAGLGFLTGCLFMLLVSFTLLMFYFIQTEDSNYIQRHTAAFIIVWITTAVAATIAKIYIVNENKY